MKSVKFLRHYAIQSPVARLVFFALALNCLLVAGGAFADTPRGGEHYQPENSAFGGDEHVVYQASWNGIPVASAVVDAKAVWLEGKRCYQVTIQATTWKYLELIWRMRDSIESVFETETLHPRRFVFHQRENRKRIDTTAVFDPANQKWAVKRQQGTRLKQFEFVSPHTFDPISASYLARTLDFEVGDTLQLEVFGGKSRYLLQLDVVAAERIALRAGEIDAFKIIPRLQNLSRSGYAGRLREATVWISADRMKRPLKLVSQVFLGAVTIEMVNGVR